SGCHKDRNGCGGALCRQRCESSGCRNDIDLESDQVRCEFGQPLGPILRIALIKNDVLALDPSQLPQSIKKNCTKHGGATCAEDAYRISLLGLLCACRERPRGRAAEQDDELSPPHVSRATVWRSLSGWLTALS